MSIGTKTRKPVAAASATPRTTDNAKFAMEAELTTSCWRSLDLRSAAPGSKRNSVRLRPLFADTVETGGQVFCLMGSSSDFEKDGPPGSFGRLLGGHAGRLCGQHFRKHIDRP